MEEVQNDYIEKALIQLTSVFGTKEFVDHEKLIRLIGSNKTKEAIKEIAQQLGLPIEVNVSYVPKGYRPNANDGFHSTHLVKTDSRNRGIGGITAQVSIPANLPFYRTTGMVNFPINVRLSEDCAENPATLISIMAHELSHIVLYSIWHKEKENEFYTDLTAMILGFANIMKNGRKISRSSTSYDSDFLTINTTTNTETITYGYLSDNNFEFAYKRINVMLGEQKLVKKKLKDKLEQCGDQLRKIKKHSAHFDKYLKYLDNNLHLKINPEDGYKISSFHQPGYTDDLVSTIKKYETRLENIDTNNKINIEEIQKSTVQLESISSELASVSYLMQKDLSVLKKYIGFFRRLADIFS